MQPARSDDGSSEPPTGAPDSQSAARRLWGNLAIAALAGFLVAVGPFTPKALSHSLIGGFGAGGVVLAYLVFFRKPASAPLVLAGLCSRAWGECLGFAEGRRGRRRT